MSDEKKTPGPWVAVAHRGVLSAARCASGRTALLAEKKWRGPLAVLPHRDTAKRIEIATEDGVVAWVDADDCDFVEAEELADLFAAAPDLLAALDDACDGYCSHCATVGENKGQDTCEASPSCQQREQMWWNALAKARGSK